MLQWVLDHLGVVIFVVVVVSQMLRGLLRARRDTPAPQAKPDELEAERREREIQAEIRRRRAARAGHQTPAAPPPLTSAERAPDPQPEPSNIPEQLPAPLRRMLEELQREVAPQPPRAPAPPPLRPTPTLVSTIEQRTAELQRQERLAEEMRVLEETRTLAARRAAHLAAARAGEAQTEPALRSVARGRLLDDLRDPESLRRAFVLREVLGPPVAMR